MAENADHFDLAGLSKELMALLDFGEELLLAKSWIETIGGRIAGAAGWRLRQIEDASAKGKPIPIKFRRRTIRVAPGIAGVVESACVDDRPVEEVGLRIVGIFVGIEN